MCITKQANGIHREYVYSVAVYQKISNEFERIDNFRALARKLSFLPTELDIFDIRQHYVRILFIFHRLICCVLSCLTPTNMNLAVYGNGLMCCNDVMNNVDCVIKHDVYPQKIHSCSENIRGISVFVLKISVVYQKNI